MQAIEAGEYIEAYEAARARRGGVDLRGFLPPREHPLYSIVLLELVRIDLEQSWTEGRPTSLQEYQQLYPELFADQAGLQEITFEEYRLRVQAGERASPAEYLERFGVHTNAWPTIARPSHPVSNLDIELSSMLRGEMKLWKPEDWNALSPGSSLSPVLANGDDLADSEMALLLTEVMTPSPRPGSRFHGFQLLAELGRGAFGRVYLAREGDLANRLVALKITQGHFQESQTLAQLQHTNIVPIYSVHQAKPLQAVCMPYFGPATMHDVLEELRGRANLPESGKIFTETLIERKRRLAARMQPAADGAEQPEPLPSSGLHSPVEFESMSYVEAVLWLASRLADGLAHAHDRGILHRDLKPANILLTDHGQPMLVDFNLSADLKRQAGASAALLGGTLPYMAPEHLEAFDGGTCLVDARSDLYSLGVVLYHFLTGRLPFTAGIGPLTELLPRMAGERRRGSPKLRQWNKAVPPAAESVVRRLLEPDPGRRYQSADELREDLQRHQENLPLRHAPNPSIKERVQKWIRRHPRLMSPASLVSILTVLLVSVAALAIWSLYCEEQANVEKKEREAERIRIEKRAVQADLTIARGEAEELKQKSKAALNRFRDSLVSLREREGEVQSVQQLFDIVALEREDSAEQVRRCRALLQQYKVFDVPAWQELESVKLLPETEQVQLRKEVGELLYLLARAALFQIPAPRDRGLLFEGVRLNLQPGSPGLFPLDAFEAVIHGRIQSALELNTRAAACYRTGETPRALHLQRAVLSRLAGNLAESEKHFKAAAESGPGTARDDYLAAYEYAALHLFREALPLAERAVRREPQRYASWFLLGVCREGLSDPDKALSCYGMCIALHPDWPLAYFNRGRLLLGREDWRGASDDFDMVLTREPGFAEGHLQRARARQGLKQHAGAVEDLTAVLKSRPGSIPILFKRGEARRQAGDGTGAARDLDAVLKAEAHDAQDWTCKGMARPSREPELALFDYEQALKCDPNYLQALVNQALLLARQKRVREGVTVLDRAVAAHPNSVLTRINRGILHANLGERTAAHADAEAALKCDASAPICYQAGRIFALTSRINPRDAQRALDLLAAAVRNGHRINRIDEDSAWDSLREQRGFLRLVQAAATLNPSSSDNTQPQP